MMFFGKGENSVEIFSHSFVAVKKKDAKCIRKLSQRKESM